MHGINAARSLYEIGNRPLALATEMLSNLLENPFFPHHNSELMSKFKAQTQILLRSVRSYPKQGYGIDTICANQIDCSVMERDIAHDPFCTLKLFETMGTDHGDKPPILLVAPLSGHFATLLAGTIRSLLRERRVYITDWISADQVPLYKGTFGLDEYVDYVRKYIHTIGEPCHVVSVCQSAPATLATIALMQQEGDENFPLSCSFIAGPINPDINPTEVNKAATDHSMDWFRTVAMDYVPSWKPGAFRHVRSGATQVACFWAMKKDDHFQKGRDYYKALVDNDVKSAKKIDSFYREYFTASDIPGKFFLETIEQIFKKNVVGQGQFPYRGKMIELKNLSHLPIGVIEGSRDDITGLGQTKAVFDICPKVVKGFSKEYDVGHYGAFTGTTFDTTIAPDLFRLMNKSEKKISKLKLKEYGLY